MELPRHLPVTVLTLVVLMSPVRLSDSWARCDSGGWILLHTRTSVATAG